MRSLRTFLPVALAAAAFASVTLSADARADRLLLQNIEEGAGFERPARGMRMDTVESRFGSPESRRPAVGDPPITRWIYPDFIVYFEHDRVIHAAARRDPA